MDWGESRTSQPSNFTKKYRDKYEVLVADTKALLFLFLIKISQVMYFSAKYIIYIYKT